jgi:hypothetical protein
VLDANGATIVALRGDGAGIHTLDSAHDKAYTSVSFKSALFCSKAIGTVYYLINRYSGNRTISRYVYTLHMQFKLQCNAFGEYHLSQIKKQFGTSRPETPVIDSDEALERAMFSPNNPSLHSSKILNHGIPVGFR